MAAARGCAFACLAFCSVVFSILTVLKTGKGSGVWLGARRVHRQLFRAEGG